MDDPNHATTDNEEIKADNGLLYILIPSLLLIGVLGYWKLKTWHNYYFKTEN